MPLPDQNGAHAAPLAMPTDYLEGHRKARLIDRAMADNYIAHAWLGDPVCDAMMADLSELPEVERTLLFQEILNERDPVAIANAPATVKEFLENAEAVPQWVDYDAFRPGIRLFHRTSHLVLGAFVGGTLIEGFSTNIGKSFFLTGRVRDRGVRRLRQNNRHMIEIFMPGGITRDGDGWKLSVRIRIIHAQIRHLLGESPEWDAAAWGTPISAAHVGYAITAFSAKLLGYMERLGARISSEERAGFLAVWRYAGHLMGIPSTILFHDEAEAHHLHRIGTLCEPPPSPECIAMANALINSAPLVVGIDDPEERHRLAQFVYKVSRALIGSKLADQLQYPPSMVFGTLPLFRLQERLKRLFAMLSPQRTNNSNFTKFTSLLEASVLEEAGISYRLPNRARAEESDDW